MNGWQKSTLTVYDVSQRPQKNAIFDILEITDTDDWSWNFMRRRYRCKVLIGSEMHEKKSYGPRTAVPLYHHFWTTKTSGFIFLLMIFLVFWNRTQIQIRMKMRHFGVDRVSKLGLESRLAITTQGSNYIIASWGAYLVFFGLVIGFILVEKCCPVDYSAWGRMYLWDGFGIHRLNLEMPCRLKGFVWIIKMWDALVWSLS